MTDQKPTGVFVRLPLSDEQREMMVDAAALGQPDDSHDKALIAIGTPVTGGELRVSAFADYIPPSAIGVMAQIFEVSDRRTKSFNEPLVRQSESQAQIAARDAEIGRLREALDALENANNNLCFMRSKDTYQSMLRDGCEDLLEALDRARLGAREALKGGAA